MTGFETAFVWTSGIVCATIILQEVCEIWYKVWCYKQQSRNKEQDTGRS